MINNDLRRVLLWSVFAVSLLMLWDGWLRHTGQPSLFQPAPAAAPVAQGASGADAGHASVPSAGATLGATGTAPAPEVTSTAPASEVLSFSTDVLKVDIDTLGGSVVRAEMLQHRASGEAGGNMVLFERGEGKTYVAQSGLIGQTAGDVPTHLTPFKLLSTERSLAEGQDALVVKLASDPVGGVQLVRTYTFKRGSYLVDVRQDVINQGTAPIKPQLYVQLVRDGTQIHEGPDVWGAPQSYTGPAFYTTEAKFQKVPFDQIDKKDAEFQKSAADGWVSMVQHYFTSVWLHPAAGAREFFARHQAGNLYAVGMLFPVGDVAPGASSTVDTQLYMGPQEEMKLKDITEGLELVKDYGWTHLLAKPLFWLLFHIHNLVGNWGWAIVLLVVLLKAAFYGLNASAYRSMAKMKALNPRIQALRESLKDNPQQMQQEMMKIYREEKVNPIGGCLPILIQIPVFIALYWVLLSSVEMRNAPWVGWITDLSVKDPYFVLPVLMTASTLLQTWLNPTPPDPMQAKLMWIMPLMFSVLFFFFPAGLVLYWLTNNLLSIAQQWMINRSLGVTK